MIEAIKGNGPPRASAICDDCGRNEPVTCDYVGNHSHTQKPNEGQVKTKIASQGWTIIKNRMRCPNCETARKFQKPKEAIVAKPDTNITELRRPTREQVRQIISLLEASYDTDLERYRGHDTDKTVAEAIGGGVMPGWVSEERERAFGPDGGNDEIEGLLADISEWRKGTDAIAVTAHEAIKKMNEGNRKVADMQNRLEAIRKAVGPKAART